MSAIRAPWSNTQNSEYGKIYVASPDSPYITIIESSPTVTDLIDTTVLVEGNVVDVRATTQNGNSGNNNYSSRVPGYGQPCNLSPATWCYRRRELYPRSTARPFRRAIAGIAVRDESKGPFLERNGPFDVC